MAGHTNARGLRLWAMPLLPRVALTLFFACAVALGSADAQRAKRLAEKAYDLSDYVEAVDMYEKVLRKRPNDAEAQYRYGRALRIVGRLEEARVVLDAIEDPANPAVPFEHATVLMELGRYPEAVEAAFAAAQAKHPMADALAARLEYAQAHRGDQTGWQVTGEFVNTSGDDFAPAVVGEAVVFASRRNGDELQLYRAVRDENRFLRSPQKLHRVGALPGGDAPAAYSPSGQLVALTRNNFTAGERLLPEAGWELSLALALPTESDDFLPGKSFVHNSPGSDSGFPSFSPDGQRLYFASDRPGGLGGYDIYFCERLQDAWSAPVNAGPSVNTPGNEIAPNAAKGALYFSSDYLPGFGGMDVYRADLVRGAFSAVSNVGPGVNSPLDDIGFALTSDEQIGYFASNRAGGKGGMDIYRAMRQGEAITIAVVDGKTGAPIPNAVIDFSDCGAGNFLTGADGAYTFRALPSLKCRPVVRLAGYNAKQFSIDGERMAGKPRLEVTLNPDDKVTIYEGKIVHSRTGDVVPNARVFARHKRKDFTADAVTDARGRYTLGLEREGDYVIEYDAAGMARINREVSTYDSDGAGILSTFAMFPAPGGSPSRPSREMTTGETAGVATVFDTAPTPSPSPPTRPSPPATRTAPSEATATPRPYTPPASTGTSRVTTTPAPSVEAGYAVQVAALRASSTELPKYQSALSSLGQVYGKVEGGLLKVRVGPYPDRRAAMSVMSSVRAKGYGDAWVATETGGAAQGIAATTTYSQSTTQGSSGAYLVRLATYSSLDNFDATRARGLGQVGTRRSGEYVVAVIEGLSDLSQARSTLARAKALGWGDAQVVQQDDSGVLRVVR